MKIIFFGTSAFAIPALAKLYENSDFEIVAIVTQPDKPTGRKKELVFSPVKQWALEHGVSVLQPIDLTSDIDNLKTFEADLFVVASYGKIIPKDVLGIPSHGALNIHPSLLPKYRGPSPIQTAILNGEDETGVTIMKMDEQMDHGPVLGTRAIKIEPRTTYQMLHDELAGIGAELLIQLLPKYIAGEITPSSQDEKKATYTKIITKDDVRVDWSKPANEIDRMVRAYHVWPVAWTMLDEKRLKIYDAVPVFDKKDVEPGKIYFEKDTLIIGTGSGALTVHTLQLEGGNKQDAKSFINGYKDFEGKILK